MRFTRRWLGAQRRKGLQRRRDVGQPTKEGEL